MENSRNDLSIYGLSQPVTKDKKQKTKRKIIQPRKQLWSFMRKYLIVCITHVDEPEIRIIHFLVMPIETR
jgi:uncharacterized protein YjaZ